MMLHFPSLPVSSVVQHRPDDKPGLSRREVLLGTAALAAAGFSLPSSAKEHAAETGLRFDAERIYAALDDEPFPIAAVDFKKLSPTFYRQLVDYETSEPPGTVIVDTHNRVLYLAQEGGKALRYGIGVGREGFSWSGRGEILLKKAWPTWTPPSEMIKRQPELEPYRDGMPPGPENPLGARALYIYRNGIDTLYRLHGNGDVTSIGRAVSSGCIRLLQQDIIDLYERVPEHTPIVVA
jgi:lipoprotein-anchoring transpeptidase ErfK/SrfK